MVMETLDLTRGEWPWQHWVAGMTEERRNAAIGAGIQKLSVELRADLLCPYPKNVPQANFVALHVPLCSFCSRRRPEFNGSNESIARS